MTKLNPTFVASGNVVVKRSPTQSAKPPEQTLNADGSVTVKQSNGITVTVDSDVAGWLVHVRMIISNSDYVVVYVANGRIAYLHRLLTECPKNSVVDHINGDTFDNRRQNLRVCHSRENNRHRVRLNKNNTSGKCGVYRNHKHGKWEAAIKVNRKSIYLGRFNDLDSAISARREAERKLFGDFTGVV